tara:strand:- start:1007 stop:1480 length:474 start_codon:yes stop_codon:yes gene_type:complete
MSLPTFIEEIKVEPTSEMEPKTLLQLKPELLAKAIIHRRQHLMDQLPEIIKKAKRDVKNAEDAIKFQENIASETGKNRAGTLEHEKKLRDEFKSAIGKLDRAQKIFKNSEEIISFWESKLKFGFDELLEDSQRVQNGGFSSWALRKKSTSDDGDEEE